MNPQKRLIIILGVLFLIILLWGGSFASKSYMTMKGMTTVKKGELAAFNRLAEEYIERDTQLRAFEKKVRPSSASRSVVALIEEIATRIKVKNRVTSLLPLKEEARGGYLEQGAEVKIEGIDLNRLINLLYKIEHHQALLLIREFTLESRFDNPQLLDVRIKIVQITKTSAG